MGKITEDELAMLSPEEREALEGETENKSTEEIRAEEEAAAAAKAKEEGAGEAKRTVEKKAVEEKTEEEKTVEEKAAETAEAERLEAEAKAKAAADAEAAAAVQAAKEAADLEAAQKAEEAAAAAIVVLKNEPVFTLEAEKKHGTREEIEAKMTALDTKFEDGDITLAAYNKERAEYVESLTEMKMFDKINAQVQKAAAEKGWKDAQSGFFSNNQEYSTERIKNVAFVDAVNRLLATDESKKMTDAQIFEAAKKECDAVFHPAGRSKADDSDAASIEEKRKAIEAAEKVEIEAKRKVIEDAKKTEAERAAAVKTLAKVPVSEGNQGDDKYDAIDKLTGEAYENAVAKMSDTERAIYAARS